MSLFDSNDNNVNTTNKIKKDDTKKNEKKTTKEPKIKFIEEPQDQNIIKQQITELPCYEELKNKIVKQFTENKLHHATMFSGNYGIGKATFVYWLIYCFICELYKNNQSMLLAQTEAIQNQTHPDILVLKEKTKTEGIKVDDVRELLEKMSLKSTYGYRYVIIDSIDKINTEGLNALLKTLEEPTENTYFFIINQKTAPLLNTIYSRCNEIKISLSRKQFLQILSSRNPDLTSDEIDFYTQISENSIAIAEIFIELNTKIALDKIKEINEIKTFLNNFYNHLDTQKNIILTKQIKLILLERVLFYLINKFEQENDTEKTKQNVKIANILIKQFLELKRFDLPIKF